MHTNGDYIKRILARSSVRQEKIKVINHVLHCIKSSVASK